MARSTSNSSRIPNAPGTNRSLENASKSPETRNAVGTGRSPGRISETRSNTQKHTPGPGNQK
ncbi:hypothetical protein E2562_037511 [Oryza meyeriana var. granulata]|uniref:Uncharacterized protein n=1 Tax=Oryza meyeriana var. granulata TaxID=110450 RepID=A0A6G1CCF0_9ORYZ|nr:hypothetical protein E2562_037511 [Oryza meyeriana var. granulata]